MTRPTKADVDRAYKDGYALGRQHGYEEGKKDAMTSLEYRRSLIQLVSVVGQTLQAQSQVVTGLAQVFDNIGPEARK